MDKNDLKIIVYFWLRNFYIFFLDKWIIKLNAVNSMTSLLILKK